MKTIMREEYNLALCILAKGNERKQEKMLTICYLNGALTLMKLVDVTFINKICIKRSSA